MLPELSLDSPQPFIDALDVMEVEERLEAMGTISEEDRERFIHDLPTDTKMKWINEEREHLEALAAGQPTEGADYGEDPGEEIRIEGREEPQDRAPDIPAETIAQLVQERIAAERKAAAAEQALADANSEIERYYSEFGPLPADD